MNLNAQAEYIYKNYMLYDSMDSMRKELLKQCPRGYYIDETQIKAYYEDGKGSYEVEEIPIKLTKKNIIAYIKEVLRVTGDVPFQLEIFKKLYSSDPYDEYSEKVGTLEDVKYLMILDYTRV